MAPAISQGRLTAWAVWGVSLAAVSRTTGAWARPTRNGLDEPAAFLSRSSKPSIIPVAGRTRPLKASLPLPAAGAVMLTVAFSSTSPSTAVEGSGLPPGRLRPHTVAKTVLPASTTHGETASIQGAELIVRRYCWSLLPGGRPPTIPARKVCVNCVTRTW